MKGSSNEKDGLITRNKTKKATNRKVSTEEVNTLIQDIRNKQIAFEMSLTNRITNLIQKIQKHREFTVGKTHTTTAIRPNSSKELPITTSNNRTPQNSTITKTPENSNTNEKGIKNENTKSNQTNQQPNSTTQQATTGRHQQHTDLKNQGLIKVSVHGTEVYKDAEIRCILNTMRATEAKRAGPNLITALIRTGTYVHADYGDIALTNDMELGPTFDQETQVTGNDIDDEVFAHNIQQWQPLVVETSLAENHDITASTNKPMEVVFNKRAFINYTPHPIPEDVGVILSMGPKFSVPVYYRKEDFEALKDAANMINDAYGNPLMDLHVRSNIMDHIDNHRKQDHTVLRSEVRDYFHEALKNTKNFMKQHPDIIVAQADKARATIMLNKQTYIDKGENLLKDETTYKILNSSSTPAYMKMNENVLSKMVKLKLITEHQKIEAARTENKPANIYFLIKTHKQNAPVRPIVNTRNSMFYTASKVVVQLLNPARDKGIKYNVTNSRQACERLKQLRICPDERFYSLDIVQMFTNIPVDRAIMAVKKRQKSLKFGDEITNLIIEVINHVCKISTELAFNNKFYKQIRGLRMGSSLSPILADFVVEDMLDSAFIKIQRPILLIKYVDDILTVLQTENANKFLQELNSIDPHIKFEMEEERDGVINYLDFTVYNDGWQILTKWFQKHISSGQFLNHNSHHSNSNRWNTAVQYVITMYLNSHPKYWNDIYKIALDRLTRNSYPEEYAKKIIKAAKTKITANSNKSPENHNQTPDNYNKTPANTSEPHYTYGLNYIPGLTEKVQQEIKHSAATLDNTTNIQIPAIPIYKMGRLIFDHHKNSNSTATLEEFNTEVTMDLTQPETTVETTQTHNENNNSNATP